MGGSGGGGGGNFFNYDPKELQAKIRESEVSTESEQFSTDLENYLGGQLATLNQRDDALVRERLDTIKERISDNIEDTIDLRFGGSVAKHTYVDGLSDIDSLILFRGNNEDRNPDEVKNLFATELRNAFPDAVVSAGTVAVTVRYNDGMEIQLIPAVRVENRIAVPSWDGQRWSKINPMGFQRALTDCNNECGGKVVPVIKLAKAIVSTLPDAHKLTGYHVESLAVAAFRAYDGPRTLNKMLPYFIDQISTRVLKPVVDSTGQSVHVDTYLGASNNDKRREVSHVFERLSKRIHNASAGGSMLQWQSLFEDE